MNLSGGRCFCLMLGVSLLAHGGLFLNRPPLARLSKPEAAPLSLRLAVTTALPVPTDTVESSPQKPPLASKERTLPKTTPQRESPPPKKRSTHQAETGKRRTAPPKTATPPEHSRAPQAQSAKAPAPPSPQHTVQPAQEKTEATAGPRKHGRNRPPAHVIRRRGRAEIPPAASTALPTAGATQRYRGAGAHGIDD